MQLTLIPDLEKMPSVRLRSPRAGQAVSVFLISLPCPEVRSREPTASRPQTKDAVVLCCPPIPQGAPGGAPLARGTLSPCRDSPKERLSLRAGAESRRCCPVTPVFQLRMGRCLPQGQELPQSFPGT